MSNETLVAVEQKALGFWQKNKERCIFGIVAVALAFIGFAVGRFATPPKTVVTEKVHEVTVEKVVTQVKTEVQKVYIHDSQQQQKIHRTIVEGVDPPGCRSKTTTEDINVDTVVHDNTHDTTVQTVDKVIEKWQDKIVEKTVMKLAPPDWSVYAGVGYDFLAIGGDGQHGIPGMKGFVVQAGIDRRIIGPFYMGLFLNTELIAGLNLRVTW